MKNKPQHDLLESLTFEPLTPGNHAKFEELFGEKGACGDCWCLHFRLPKKEHDAGKKNGDNRRKMKALVDHHLPTGILGMLDGKAIAWAAFAPREDFVRLAGSRIHKPIDNQKVWSIPCTFIHKDYRGKGVSTALLKGVIAYARKNKIAVLEAYPSIPSGKLPDAFLWIGHYKSFERAGFEIVDQKSPNRPMVRYYI